MADDAMAIHRAKIAKKHAREAEAKKSALQKSMQEAPKKAPVKKAPAKVVPKKATPAPKKDQTLKSSVARRNAIIDELLGRNG